MSKTSLWTILVDTSGSMQEPFSGKGDFAGVVEKGAYGTKLDAAKEILLRRIRGLSKSDVAVIGFADTANLICKGRASDIDQFEKPIRDLTANGMTNLASALSFAQTELGNLKDYKVVSFLVITDGLSNVGDPIKVAQQITDSPLGIRISTVLIDPTPEGEQIARAVSIGGEVTAVTSSIQLEKAIVDERAAVVSAAQRAAQETTFFQLIAGLGGLAALSVAIGGIYTAIVERPFIAIPAFLAALATIAAGICIYLILAKEQSDFGFFRNPNDTNLFVPKKYKYERRKRYYAVVGAGLCIVLAVLLISFAIVKVSGTIPPLTSTPTATPTLTETATPTSIPTITPTALPTFVGTSTP